MNTKVKYMYRDACNYKTLGDAIFTGTLTEAEKKSIKDATDGERMFIPEQVGMPPLREEYPTIDDHCWHEFISIEDTTEKSTETITAKELLDNFLSVEKWDDVTYAVDIPAEQEFLDSYDKE